MFLQLMHARKGVLLFAGLLSLTVFGLAGCGSSENADLEAGKNVLRVTFGPAVESLDPAYVKGTWDRNQAQSLFDNLFVRGNDGRDVASLAESYQVSSDFKKWTFHLRKATFSDGSPLTADDVVFSIRRILDPQTASAYAFILEDIQNASDVVGGKKPVESLGVKALDSQTVEFDLAHPVPYFTDLLTHQTASILPKKAVEQYGNKWTRKGNIISSGAYVLEEFVPKDHLTLIKNEKFWDAANVNIDKVVFYPINDSDVAVRRYKAGELDFVANNVSPDVAVEMRKTNPQEISITPYLATEFLVVSATRPELSDIRVREALSLAVDRERLVNEVEQGIPKATLTLVAPGIADYRPSTVKAFEGTTYEERLKKAQDLMRAAGYSEDKPLEVTYSINNVPIVKKRAVAIMDFWSNIFVKAQLLQQDTSVHYKDLDNNKFQVARGGWVGDYADPTTFLVMWKSTSTMNYTRAKIPGFDAQLEASYLEKDPQKRMMLLMQAEQTFLEAFYVLPLFNSTHTELHSPVITNFTPTLTADYMIRFLKVSR